MFGVNTKSAATICRGCLSMDRRLSPLTNNTSYFNLLTDEQKQGDMVESEILLCWECIAALKRVQSFQEQAQKAHMVLETSYNPASIRSLSTLTTYHKDSYDAIFHEIKYEEKGAQQFNSIVPVTIPIKQEMISVEFSDEEDYNDIEDIDNNELCSEVSLEENTVTNEFKPFTVIKTKIKVKSLVENEDFRKTRKSTRQTIVKKPSLPHIKKRSLKNIVINKKDLITNKNIIKKSSTSPLQPSQGLRKSKRKSEKVEERKSSNECNVNIGDYFETNNTELKKEDNASDSDIGDKDDIGLSIFNKDGFENKEVKANEIDFLKTDKADDSGNCERNNAYTHSTDDKSKEAVLGKVLEQSEENEEDESNDVHLDGFRKTIVEYSDFDEVDTYFTKLELSEEETKAALEGEPKYANKELPYMCNYCGLCFKMKKTMLNHVKSCHVQLIKTLNNADPNIYYRNSMYRCNNCPAVLRKTHTAAHMKYVHRNKYYCKHCNMGFWNNKDCKSHLVTNHSSFDCDLCSETRPTWKLLEQHIKRKHQVRKQYKRPVQCEECGKKVPSSYSLISHQETRHPREGTDPRFRCEPCKVTLRSEKHYRWHMTYHKAHKQKPRSRYACPTCGKECSSTFVLKHHYDRFHTDKTDFQCKFCGKYLASKCSLNTHVDRVHLNVALPKDKLCTICGRGFSNNRILTHHIRTHTGERPFACEFCPAAFAQRSALKQHTATQHEKNKTKHTRQN